jgi:uncharacterized protein (DUF1800 family)
MPNKPLSDNLLGSLVVKYKAVYCPILKLFCLSFQLIRKGILIVMIGYMVQTILSSYESTHGVDFKKIKFPYRAAGLTPEAAAAHLLSRFTFGATPSQIDEVVKEGLENWFLKQLQAKYPDDSLQKTLSQFDALNLSNTEIIDIYPRGGREVRMAIKDGVLNKDSVDKQTDKKAYKAVLDQYMKDKGLRPQQELYKQFISQKILRAAYSENQLQEVMTSFWFNHFNVALVKNDCAEFIPNYEKDIIRPRSLGKFEDLLVNTAKSPAMLYYLDNFSSAVAPDTTKKDGKGNTQKQRQLQGLNENYAREVMELHTLGVDGGYTQSDVTQAAKVLTGWTVYPIGDFDNTENARQKISADSAKNPGWVHEGDFLFNPKRHDMTQKVVLGHVFYAGGGYEEGLELFDILSHHASTARFICREIAVRFVNDTPATSLVEKMTKTFIQSDGDIRAILITMVTSPEFWSPQAIQEKIKSPFELAISSVRSLSVHIEDPNPLNNWIGRMGEKMYNYQAPTGFPDRGLYWINTGSLLNRMNFGLAFAGGRIQGITIDLLSLNNHHEPESASAALEIYGKLLIPLSDSVQMQKRLSPLLNDPSLAQKVSAAALSKNVSELSTVSSDSVRQMNMTMAQQRTKQNNAMLAQVVGVLIGSPEFQRR